MTLVLDDDENSTPGDLQYLCPLPGAEKDMKCDEIEEQIIALKTEAS